jgi:hypothetical protein
MVIPVTVRKRVTIRKRRRKPARPPTDPPITRDPNLPTPGDLLAWYPRRESGKVRVRKRAMKGFI